MTFEGDKDNPAIIYKDYIPQNKYQSAFYNDGLSNLTFKNIIFQDKTEKPCLGFFCEEDSVFNVSFKSCTADIPLELRHCSDVSISGSTFNNIDSSRTKDITFANSSIKKINAKRHLSITLASVKNLESISLQDVYGSCIISESNLPNVYTDNIQFCNIYRSSIGGFKIQDSYIEFDHCYFSAKPSFNAYKCEQNNILSFYYCKTKDNHASIESPVESMNIPINTPGGKITSDSEGDMSKEFIQFIKVKPNYTQLNKVKQQPGSNFKNDLKIRNKHPFVKAIQQDEAAYRRTSTDGRGV